MTFHVIVKAWLAEHGYDGLYNEDADCGCRVDDLMPCGEPGIRCRAGHVVPCDPDTCEVGGECPWHIGEKDCTEKGTPPPVVVKKEEEILR